MIFKTPRQSFWKTQIINGRKNRFPVDPEAEEVKQYYKEQQELQEEYVIKYLKEDSDPKKVFRQARAAAVHEMWIRHQRCYYFCGGVNLSAFAPGEEDYLTEIYDLVDEIVFHRIVKPKLLQPEEANHPGKEEFDAK